jgi:hypothetical protein
MCPVCFVNHVTGLYPLFLPRDAGEDEGEGLNGAQRLNDLNDLNSSDRFSEINFDDVRIFCHARRQTFGDFFSRAQNRDTMGDIE